MSIFLIALDKHAIHNNAQDITSSYLVLAGFLMSAGVVVPGVSKSVILIMLGVYEKYLLSISTFNFTILMPIIFGLIIGCAIFLSLINFLFEYFKSYTYFAIIGFVIGSCFVLYPRI